MCWGASLGGMVAPELAIRHAERVDGLVLACTTPGWPFAYPMPAPSVRLLAATARLPTEAARIPPGAAGDLPGAGPPALLGGSAPFAGEVTAFLLGGGPRS
jgi:pimeloyl-ACP methyl ester carboxylesterase